MPKAKNTTKIKSEDSVPYIVECAQQTQACVEVAEMTDEELLDGIRNLACEKNFPPLQDMVIELAGRQLLRKEKASGEPFREPSKVSRFLSMHLHNEEREVFVVIFLDSQHRLIACKNMFYGTIDSAAVYPREVVKEALRVNAAAVILAHNHPSGSLEPSAADRTITTRIQSALSLVEIRTLDHFVVGSCGATSFAERGWI